MTTPALLYLSFNSIVMKRIPFLSIHHILKSLKYIFFNLSLGKELSSLTGDSLFKLMNENSNLVNLLPPNSTPPIKNMIINNLYES